MTERAYRVAVVAAKLDELGFAPHALEIGSAYSTDADGNMVHRSDVVSMCIGGADEFTRIGDAFGLGDAYRRGNPFDYRIGVFEDVPVCIFGADLSAVTA
jgi:hypothetical protein